MAGTVRGPGTGPRSGGRPAPRSGPGAFTSRRAPGSRRSGGAGLSLAQRMSRNRIGLGLLVLLLVVVVGRLAVVQGIDGARYANAAAQDRLRTYPIAAIRGEITDREGRPFAYTADASTIAADPTVVTDPARAALALTTLLDVPVAELTEKLAGEGRYQLLAEGVPPETADAVRELGLAGIVITDAPERRYPAGAVGGQVVGLRRPRRHRPGGHRADLRGRARRHAGHPPARGGQRRQPHPLPRHRRVGARHRRQRRRADHRPGPAVRHRAAARRGLRRRFHHPRLGRGARRAHRRGRRHGLLPRLRPRTAW
ncbi:hypothetical protein [Blastococcus sp. TML/M2B]|uniref:hypothetical protein n=1 Tax=Blastococcus sp. TML/M2B TaxID=2798727 RepID=UPI0028167503|nr:hypothetical protein [Blastococcus sp. TML/M2B]